MFVYLFTERMLRIYECIYMVIGYRLPFYLISLCRVPTPPHFGFYDAIGIVPIVGKMGIITPFYIWRN